MMASTLTCSSVNEPSNPNRYLMLPTTITSRVPFVGTIRKLKSAASRIRQASNPSSLSSGSTPITTSNSAASTAVISDPVMNREHIIVRTDTTLQSIGEDRSLVGGVDWQAAALGYQMLGTACQRSTWDDTGMSRSIYLDAVKYLHSGLPSDLTEDELRSLCDTLHPKLQRDASQCIKSCSEPDRSPNVVRSSTSRLISLLITVFILVVPIFASLLDSALRYERQYHVTERVTKSASAAGLAMGEHMVTLSQSQFGGACLSRLGWIAQSIAEGMGDGLEETLSKGTVRIRLRRDIQQIEPASKSTGHAA